MKQKWSNRFIAFIISVIFVTNFIVSVSATSTPTANNPGVGGQGSIDTAAFMVTLIKAYPSKLGISETNWKTEGATGSQFTSKSEATLYAMAQKEPNIPRPMYGGKNSSSENATSMSQLYSWDDKGYKKANLLIDHSNSYTVDVDMYAISARSVSDITNSTYSESNGIFTSGNEYMKQLLAATKNGTSMEDFSKTYISLWDKYVNSSGSSVTSNIAITYRKQFMSAFSGYFSGSEAYNNFVPASNTITNYLESYKKGTTVGGISIPNNEAGEIQAANIQCLIMASFSLVFGNPAAGVNFNGTTVSASESYKGNEIKNTILGWADTGFQSNQKKEANDYYIAFRVDSYSRSGNYFDRYDMSTARQISGTQYSFVSVTPKSGGYNNKYSLAGAGDFFYGMLEDIIQRNNSMGKNVIGVQAYWNDQYIWTQAVMRYSVQNQASISANTRWNFQGNVTFESSGWYNKSKTVATGFTYIAPGSGQPKNPEVELGNSYVPNMKFNSTLTAEKKILSVGELGKVELVIDLRYPNEPTNDIKNKYNLEWSNKKVDGNWRSRKNELDELLHTMERAINLPNTSIQNAKLPVSIYIKKKGTEDNEIGINSIKMEGTCGKHDIKVTETTKGLLVITFNILPTGNPKICNQSYSKLSAGSMITTDKFDVHNCIINNFLNNTAEKRIVLSEDDIKVSNDNTLSYDIEVAMNFPNWSVNEEVYGDSSTDLLKANGVTKKGLGYSKKPTNGAVYPASDWVKSTNGYSPSEVIQRSITYNVQQPILDTPSYDNTNADKLLPFYSEIKQGSSILETFEAMSGVPTTINRSPTQMYLSVGATDLRISLEGKNEAPTQTGVFRTYRYTANATQCWEDDVDCAVNDCAGHGFHDVGSQIPYSAAKYESQVVGKNPDGSDKYEDVMVKPEQPAVPAVAYWDQDPGTHTGDLDCGATSCAHSPAINHFHPTCSHTLSYSVKVPINEFSYFDITSLEIWGLTNWGLNGNSKLFVDPYKSYSTKTAAWVFNVGNYSSGNGRLIFSTENKWTGSTETKTATFSNKLRDDLFDECLAWINDTKNATPEFKVTVISDFVVVETSEGYQTPYFYSQESSNAGKASTAPDCSATGFGSSSGEAEPVEFDILTNDDYWWKNTNKLTCASPKNGWKDTSITYGGYNGKYNNLSNKYNNSNDVGFITVSFPLAKHLNMYGISYTEHPGYRLYGNKSTEMNHQKNANNTEHIKNDLLLNNVPNGEYDTGTTWLQYTRFINYDKDGKIANDKVGVFPSTNGLTIWRDENIPYHSRTDKVNDIVIHNPVSAEGALILSNPTVYDQRTNSELMQSSDPIGLNYGVCPDSGCQFSTLTCTTPLSIHSSNCYMETIITQQVHIGNNVHEHTDTCGYPDTCSNILNKHDCTDACYETQTKLNCSDPHHYLPGDPTDRDSPFFHYAIGDYRCYDKCGDNSRHSQATAVSLPDGTVAKVGGVFINLDREFKIYFPLFGDFQEDPTLAGISDTSSTRGKGYTNNMDTSEYTASRFVIFPFNVIAPNGKLVPAYWTIDLNEYDSTMTQHTFTFYCVLGNLEASESKVDFIATSNNSEYSGEYFNDSINTTNKDRVDQIKAARHSASITRYIDLVGSIASLTMNDTGDYRFSNFFKKARNPVSWLIENLVPEVNLSHPNMVVTDGLTVRLDKMSSTTSWTDTYGNMFNPLGGKSKQSKLLPLRPEYNNIQALNNQPMRPGYQLFMDIESIGNYYGETLSEETDSQGNIQFADINMMQKLQIRPMYYSLDLTTGKYTPVDVYYGQNGNYMKVNQYKYDTQDNTQDYYYYLDWLNESARRNHTVNEANATKDAQAYRSLFVYGSSNSKTVRVPGAARDIIGSANAIFLNDLNRTFIGSSKTYGNNKNPGNVLNEAIYNMQSQRWHFTLGLPSSSVFVLAGTPCTTTAIESLQSEDKIIVCTLDIKVQGEVWTLQYDGDPLNIDINSKNKFTYKGKEYQPPSFNENGIEVPKGSSTDNTSTNPIVVIYPSDKTSKDDLTYGGTH